MEFLLFQIPYLGNGMVIGVNAVIHDILSHGVAIGLVAMIAMAEYIGIRRNSDAWAGFAGDMLKPAIVLITGIGAITGVGIWFTTSALSPRGIGSLLRVFFWPWFIEWIVFTLELIVILIYYFMRDSWDGERKKYRVYFGSAYVLLGSVSAFLITGILGFMLTPDGWPWDRSFWPAFFNPSFPPQLLLRLSWALGLGALFASGYLFISKREVEFRKEAVRLFGKVVLLSVVSTAFSAWWYIFTIPSAFKTHMIFSVLTSHFSQKPELFRVMNGAGAFLLILFCIGAVKGSARMSGILIIPSLIVMFAFGGEFERIREFIRGPYIIPGYMYSNQVLLKETPYLGEEGMLKNAYWFNQTERDPTEVQKGAYLFGANCSTCHTIGGINDIRERVRGRSEDGISVILAHTHDMAPFMPPFSGQEGERLILAKFLYGLSQGAIHAGCPSRYTPFIERDNGE
jgi:MFS family permease